MSAFSGEDHNAKKKEQQDRLATEKQIKRQQEEERIAAEEKFKEEKRKREEQLLRYVCPNGIKSFIDLIATNPYDNIKFCYKVGGQLIQLLSRTTGIYSLNDTPLYPFPDDFKIDTTIFLDFDPVSAPKFIVINAWAIGQGAYEYNAGMGGKKIISKLKVINLE